MKNSFYQRPMSLLMIVLIIFLSACDTKVEVAPNKVLDTEKLADIIEKNLKGSCVGYQFTIGFKGENKTLRAGGDARLAPDPSPKAMTILDRYTLASVSKNITAAAIMQLLAAKNLNLNDKIFPYLPAHWNISAPLKTITFRQLMTHTSGLYDAYVDYKSIKTFADTATTNAPIGYRNVNYALFRFVIVNLAGKSVTPIPAGSSADDIAIIENKQALEYGQKYVEYCQENIFTKIGLNNINCMQVESSLNPGLCYQFPKQGKAGEPWGDMTSESASQGWYMTSAQLSSYLGNLLYTEKILPKNITDQMKVDGLGFFSGSTINGVHFNYHNGYYPGDRNRGELNTIAIAYENGIVIGLIINSQYVNTDFSNNYGIALHAAIDSWSK